MSETIERPPIDPATVVVDDPNGTGGIEEQRTAFDEYLKTRYPEQATTEFPRPMIQGAAWPIKSADVGIDNAEVWDPDDGVIVIVPLYSGMAVGDQVGVIGFISAVVAKVNQEDIDNKYLSLVVPSKSIPEGKYEISYLVVRKDNPGASQKLSVLVRFGQPGHEGNGTPLELQAPVITKPGTAKVGESEARTGVEVTIPAYKRMREFDTISLFWGDEVIEHDVTSAEVGKSIVIKVDQAAVLAAGDSDALPVYYYVSDEVGNESEWSADAFAHVAVTALSFAAPNIVDPREPGSTSVATLDLDKSGGEGVQITAGGFQVDDKVTVKWRSTSESGMVESLDLGTVVIKSADELVQFTVAQEKLWNLAGGSGRAYYEVTRNGVLTISQSAYVNFVGSLPNTPPALSIDGAETVEMGWWVDADLPFAYAVIPQSTNLAAGDTVSLVMRGTAADGATLLLNPRSHKVTANQAGNELRMRLRGSRFLKPLDGGFVDMYYTIKRGSGKVESIRERFFIGYIQETLPAPTTEVDLSVSNNVLNPTLPEYAIGVYIEIPSLSDVTAPYTLTLVWETSAGGYHEQEQNIEVGDEATAFLVPDDELKLDAKAVNVTVYYIVSQDGKPDRASVNLEFTIATADMLVNPIEISQGTMFIQGGVLDVLVWPEGQWGRWPDRQGYVNNRSRRLPTGGVPPFSYVSSNTSVAAVDGDGWVTAKRNGHAAITITDSKNSSVSYPVKVEGVFWAIYIQAPMTFSQAIASINANPLGDPGCTHRAITANEVALLESRYGRPLPLKYPAWTGEAYKSGGGLANFVSTSGGVSQTFPNNTSVRGVLYCKIPKPL